MKKQKKSPDKAAKKIAPERLSKVSGENRRPMTREEARQELLKRTNPGSGLGRLNHL